MSRMSNIHHENESSIHDDDQTTSDEENKQERGNCWTKNIYKQFPLQINQLREGNMSIDVCAPHKGFIMNVTVKDGVSDGKSELFSPEYVQIASLTFVKGVLTGECVLNDYDGVKFFEGYLKNGYREGKGKEYDEKGEFVCEGFYKHGKKLKMEPMKEMKGYWKKLNEKNEVISICKKNEKNENDGICFFYVNGKIDKVSEWKNGKELNVLKRFEGKKMIEFEDGVKRYEGEYRDSMTDGYCREGNGKEYDTDGKSLIYQGQFWNGKRYGQGKEYINHQLRHNCIWVKGYSSHRILRFSVIWFFICIICSFYLIPSVGMTLLITNLLLLWLLWRYNPAFSVVLRNVVKRSETTPRNHDSSSDPRIFTFLLNWLAFIHCLNSLIPVLIVISSFQKHSIVENCFGSDTATSLIILSGMCNDHSISQFDIQSFKALESIRVGDHCFENVNTFKIDGLDRLKLLVHSLRVYRELIHLDHFN